VIKWWIWLYIW